MVKNSDDLWMESDDDSDDLPEEIDGQQKKMDDMQYEIDEQDQVLHDQQQLINYQAKVIRELREHIDSGTQIMNQQLKFTAEVLKLFQTLAKEMNQKCGSSVADQPAQGTSTGLLMDGLNASQPKLATDTGGRELYQNFVRGDGI